MRLALLAIPAVRSAVSLELGRAIEYHASIASTQQRARALAAQGAAPLIVVADVQTAGLGTKGRSWDAPRGAALLASWLYRPAPAAPGLYAVLAGVAVARALDQMGVRDARLKWPNDVVLGQKKVAGVLAHGTTGAEGGSLVVGIGINVHQTTSDLAGALASTATSLAIVGADIDRLVLLVALTRELDRVTPPASRDDALAEWRRRATLLGREVEVVRDGSTALRGIARDIADDGALVVDSERVVAGEVHVIG
jgi:BirA family biotin operon repressor/biotin-[acetyl-CoA-carboxylase] ligase